MKKREYLSVLVLLMVVVDFYLPNGNVVYVKNIHVVNVSKQKMKIMCQEDNFKSAEMIRKETCNCLLWVNIFHISGRDKRGR